MTWWTLLNPGAGGKVNVRDRVTRALSNHGVDAEIQVTENADHLQALVDRGCEEGATHFLAVGGDGTASLVVDALLRREWQTPPVLGILPAGSGSDFVRTFGIPQDPEGAVAHLTGPEVYPVDVGVVEGSFGTRHFLNAVNVGLLAATVQRAERLSRRLGGLRYRAAFWMTLPRFDTFEGRVATERHTFAGRAATIVLANGQFFGGGVNIAPRSALADALLDVQVFAISKWQVPLLYRKAMRGLHLRHPAVKRYRSGRLEIDAERHLPVEVDGDFLGLTPISVHMKPRAIRFKI
jgi:YegS/Rv2252/BmrU family lipid kinase